MARIKLSKRSIDAVPKRTKKGHDLYYDLALPGFGLKVFQSGTKVFFVEYGPRGKRKRMSIGRYGVLTPEEARIAARQLLATVVQGGDPLAEKKARKKIPTFSEWVDEYMDGVKARKKQPRHDHLFLKKTKKRWGDRRLDTITRRQVELFMKSYSERGKTTANRWLASVRACFQHAVQLEIIQVNPAMGIKPYRESPPRSRVLNDKELAKVIEAIGNLKDPFAKGALELIIETGARKSEVLRAKWEDFDLDAGTWRIPSPKAGYPQVMPLSRVTVDRLRKMVRLGPYLVPGRDPEKPRSDIKRAWDTVRTEAKVADVNLHDLRRTFGLAVAKSAGLHVASKLLRHSDIRVTERVYAPLGLDDLRVAMEVVNRARSPDPSTEKDSTDEPSEEEEA